MRTREDYTKSHPQHNVDVDTPSHHHMHAEDRVSTMLEEQTSKIPSVAYLTLALGAMGVSAALMMSGDKKSQLWGNFVGQWAPSILIIGFYNKFVKRLGH